MKKVLYIELDVHKESIRAAIAPQGEEEVRYVGTIPNNSAAVLSLIRKMTSTGALPCFAYEAGPGGHTLFRQILELQGINRVKW